MYHYLLTIYLILLIPTAYLTLKSLEFLLSVKEGFIKKGLFLTGCALLISMIIFIGDLGNLPPTILFFLFCVIFCCRGSFLQKITIGFMFASMAFSFNTLCDNYLPVHGYYSNYMRLLFWCVVYLLIRHFAPEKDYELSDTLWKLLLFITFIPLGIVLSIVLLSDPEFTYISGIKLIYFILLLLTLLSFIGLLQTITVLAKQQKLERQNIFMSMNQKYYETLEQQQFEIRRLKHDMSNHLQVLSSLSDNEKNTYINELLQLSAFTQTVRYCGDTTINAVISSKTGQMEKNQIAFLIKADIPKPLPFKNVDTCSIFANALDNAIEYCLKLPISKRKIYLETFVQKGLFALRITNPYIESNTFFLKDNIPETSKKDAGEHGYGLKSIRETVFRYEGHMEIRAENNEFMLFIYIPLADIIHRN